MENIIITNKNKNMAKECLEIRLPGVATSNDLPKVGEARFAVASGGDVASKIQLSTKSLGVTIRLLSGNGFFSSTSDATSGTTSVSLASGSNVIYLKLTGKEDILCIENCHLISALGATDNSAFFVSYPNSPILSGDIEALGVFTKLETLFAQGTQLYGDISVFKENNISLVFMDITGTKITGNIASLSHCLDMRIFRASNTKITGDIDVVRNWVILSSISLTGTNVYGNLSSLSNSPAVSLLIGSANIKGDINSLSSNVRGLLMDIQTDGVSFSGNGDAKFLTIDTIKVPLCPMATSDIDNLLIMASKATTWQTTKAIVLKGSRSAASDSAVSILQSKGVTVTINP